MRANKEVILTAGSLQSPQLLQLSGVRRSQVITKHGNDMVHKLPGIGQNLQDNLNFTSSYQADDTNNLGIGLTAAAWLTAAIYQCWRKGTGMIATPFAEGGAFFKTDKALDRPDIQLHFVISVVDNYARRLHLGYRYSCHVCALRPYSHDNVFLKSAGLRADPGIDPKFLSDSRDLVTMIAGAK
jgi:choline dehydrogenase-like flavoprotein